MRRCEATPCLHQDTYDLVERVRGPQPLAEVLPLDQLHRDERLAIALAHVVDADHAAAAPPMRSAGGP